MEQNISWEANTLSASQEIPRPPWNPLFITVFTKALPIPWPCVTFLEWGAVSPPPNPRLEEYSLSTVPDSFSIFLATCTPYLEAVSPPYISYIP